MQPALSTVSYHVVEALADVARARHLDLPRLWLEAGLSDHPPGQRIQPLQFAGLIQALWRQTGDECMGLTQQPLRVGCFPLMMRAALSAETVGEALQEGIHFYRVLTEAYRWTLTVIPANETDTNGQALARLSLTLAAPACDPHHVLTESLLLCWYRWTCWLVNQRILLHSTQFDYPAPPHSAEYHQLFPCPHHFDADDTAILFPADWLAQPIVQTRDALKRLIRTLPLGFFVKPVFQGSWGHRVRTRLRQALPGPLPDIDQLAAEWHVCARTLRRKLGAEDTRFQDIKDALRRDRALQLLRQSEATIEQVALAVGYREPSVFIKAFKSWTGMTPGAYRHRQAQAVALRRP